MAAAGQKAVGGRRVTNELRALTSVRGIAAWFVVLYHIRKSIADLPDWGMAIFAHGYLAVDFFFLLSGFVIWMSSLDRIREGGSAAALTFLKRRIARIWPLHMAMLLFGIALATLLLATGRSATHFPFGELPLHILLLQNWGFTDRLAWNDPAWSISCELAAYLLFPLLAFTVDWRRVPTIILLAALLGLIALLHAVFAAQGYTSLGQDIPRLGVVRCLIEFTAGTVIGALWLRWRGTSASTLPATVAAILALAAAGAGIAGMLPETLAAPTAFAAALLALALIRMPLLEATPLHYLGEISYATYLGHYLLWFAFKLLFVSDARAVSLPLIALYLAMVLVSSVGLYHLIERPAQRWINGLTFRPMLAKEPA